MLKTLHISRVAIIDDITLHFNQGLTALTGETGAGKSIIMESLQLLFGKRSDQTLIRDGYEEAIVSGTFVLNTHVRARFELPEEITIERVISKTGKHLMKLNDKPVTLQMIKTITPYIGDIHEQEDMYQLLDPNQYLEMLDARNQEVIEPLKVEYLLAKSSYEDHIKKIEQLKLDHQSFLTKQDMYAFQKQELDALNLTVPSLKTIEEELDALKHFDLIKQQLTLVSNLSLEGQLDHQLYDITQALKKIAPFLGQSIDINELNMAYYTFNETFKTVSKTLEQMDFNDLHFEQLQQRSFDIMNMLKKYQMDEEALISYHESLSMQLSMANDYEAFIKDANKTLQSLKEHVILKAKKLSEKRKIIATSMEVEIIEVLHKLALEHAKFQIELTQSKEILPTGMDEVAFNISLNEGESLKPLHKVASGGERARFMFALKATHAMNHHVSMLILDEIDTGVSGQIASKVAQFMSTLSSGMQVVIITHLPQVAARAKTHIAVKKVLKEKRMVTEIYTLEGNDRITHIAMMLSDENISPFAIEQAKVLLKA
jgi:DNA repair protein RecN (Recombination protein N)